MKCAHCGGDVNPKYQWNRSGYIWCGKTCYFEDWHWLQEMKKRDLIPHKRKKV